MSRILIAVGFAVFLVTSFGSTPSARSAEAWTQIQLPELRAARQMEKRRHRKAKKMLQRQRSKAKALVKRNRVTEP